jgi:hypothetical protein
MLGLAMGLPYRGKSLRLSIRQDAPLLKKEKA